MPKKNTHITVTDQFCGCGGSSQGASNYGKKIGGGIEIKLALNHWKLAIETHNTNFPDTIHECTDVSACDPRRYPSTDILITSPECTNHTLAKGVKIVKKQMDLFSSGKEDAAAERSRATMWDVCRFAEYHNYNCIIVENVVDAKKWVMFDAWIMAMNALGYNYKCVYQNSMFFYPTPQSRDRMYIVFWKKGNKAPQLDYTPKAWCVKCAKDIQAVQTWKDQYKQSGKYKQQYVYCCSTCTSIVSPYYYAAFNCIDWSDIGQRIGDRKKSLSENTIKRIEYGLKKYGKEPFIVQTVNGKFDALRNRSLSDAFFTQTGFQSQSIVSPFIINDQHSTGIDFRVKSVSDQIPTVTSSHQFKLVTPFIVEMNKTGECKPASETTATITAGGINHAVVTAPFIPIARGQSMARSSFDPLSTQSGMINHGIVTTEAWNSFISHVYGNGYVKRISEPIGSVRTKECHELINYQEPVLEDCYYRMLKPPEIQLAMAFEKEYTVLGSGKDKVKQLGNAVTPPVMEWLIQKCVESLN